MSVGNINLLMTQMKYLYSMLKKLTRNYSGYRGCHVPSRPISPISISRSSYKIKENPGNVPFVERELN